MHIHVCARRWTAAALLASALLAPGMVVAAEPSAADRANADRAAALITQWRAAHGLPPVPRSAALDRVAEAHALDMASAPDGGASPDIGRDARGIPCNLHSWSDRGKGRWNPVCYTGDHKSASGMWTKPREIAGELYRGPGYEIAGWSSAPMRPEDAVENWKRSPAHNDVLLERGPSWTGARWAAMGVAVVGHYAYVWFGKERDGVQLAFEPVID